MSLRLKGKTLVIQPYPGIGDMLWHLPYLRSIASAVDSGKVSVLTKSRTLAKQWLIADPIVDVVYYGEKDEIFKTAKALRDEKFTNAIVLHGSFTYAAIPFLASIKNRFGYGFGVQKFWLNQKPYLESSLLLTHAIELGEIYMHHLFGDAVVSDRALIVEPSTLKIVRESFKNRKGIRICFGIGASDGFKKWPPDFFAALAIALQKDQPSAEIFLLGSPNEQAEVQLVECKIKTLGGNASLMTHLRINEVFAFIKDASLFVGNDSGLMNAAACLGVPTLGLFGKTKPLDYVANLFPITPYIDNSDSTHKGMYQILPEQVVRKYQEIKPLIAVSSTKS